MAVFNRLNNTISTRIEYSMQDSPYGRILMGTTPKGLCYFTFMDEETQPMENFEKYFKNHDRIETPQNPLHQEILKEFIREDKSDKKAYSLHVLGTDFQFAVWNRSEEHTSELQSRENLVCRLLLEKKKEETSR